MSKSLINKKEHLICLIAVAVLLALTALFLFKDHELSTIITLLKTTDVRFILLALITVVLFFALEARAVQILSQPLIGKRKFASFYRYSLIDFYFSSITPGCSGGQPSQLYFMHRDNIPVSSSSLAVLTFNMTYHVAVLLIAGISFLLSGFAFWHDFGAFRYLLLFGVAAQSLLVVFYLIAIFNKRLAGAIVCFIVKVLAKLRIVKDKQAALEGAQKQIAEYRSGAAYMKANPLLLLRTLLLSCVHILALYAIPFWVFKSFGLDGHSFIELVAVQAALTLSVESLPIPGGIGVTESGFMLIYGSIFGANLVVPALLLTRGINYYIGLLCGGIVSAYSMRSRKIALPINQALSRDS